MCLGDLPCHEVDSICSDTFSDCEVRIWGGTNLGYSKTRSILPKVALASPPVLSLLFLHVPIQGSRVAGFPGRLRQRLACEEGQHLEDQSLNCRKATMEHGCPMKHWSSHPSLEGYELLLALLHHWRSCLYKYWMHGLVVFALLLGV